MRNNAVERLTQILSLERDALLAGDLETVGAMTAEKEALTASFEAADGQDLRQLSAALTRNGALLAAARDGVTTVLETLQKQRSARTTLSSYDRSGKATTISNTAHGTERRF